MNEHIIQQDKLYPIRTVATLTGVNATTLRAWERRYGLLQPLRTKKGHRLYSQRHIDQINQIVSQLKKGANIGQVAEHTPDPQAKQDIWQQYQQRMINAIVRFDPAHLDDSYNDALALYPVEVVTEKLIEPLLRALGERWASGEGSVAEEHFFGCYLRNKLGTRFHHEASRAQGPLLLAACLPGEQHESGLLLAALSIMAHGYRVVLLGADTPLTELVIPAKQTGAVAILLSGSIDPASRVLREDLPALIRQCKLPVLIGGSAAIRHCDAIVAAGADAIGTDSKQALQRLDKLRSQGFAS